MVLQASIFNMFAKSPIRPLQLHMAKADQCAQALVPFFTAVIAKNWDEAAQHLNTINTLEHEADEMKSNLRLQLPRGLFLPLPRADLLELLHLQDEIANRAKDIAGLVFGRRMQFPIGLAERLPDFLHRCLTASAQALTTIEEIHGLVMTGFSGAEVKILEEMIQTLNRIEHETDEEQMQLRQRLFDAESQLPAVDTVFFYKLIDWIGAIADDAQEVGGRVQLFLAR